MSKGLAKESVMGQYMDKSLASEMTSGVSSVAEGFVPRDLGTDDFGGPLGTMDELDWLLSLALDDQLDEQEAARLETLLAQEPSAMERQSAWHAVDSYFQQVPAVLPPVDFAAKFDERLAIWERRRRLRTGIVFGLVAVALWGSALGGTVLLGALLWTNQSVWLGGLIHNVAYWWSALVQFGRAFGNAGEALWAAPQMRAVVLCYFLIAMGILATWFTFLRNSLQENPVTEA
jgi:hypothetical protein